MNSFALLVTALLTLGPLCSATANYSPAPTKIRLALNWKAEPQFGGFYAAALNGEFKKRGLEVEILEGGSGTPTAQMISSGAAEFGIVSAEEILLARQRGADVIGLFAVFQTNPQAIMTQQERGLNSLKEVFESDGILSWQSGLSYAQYLAKKYPNSKVQKVPYTGGIASFLKTAKFSQQCFITSEPLLAEKAGKKVKTFLVSEEGFNPYTTVLATTGARLKSDEKTVRAMTEAVRAGWNAYLTDPTAANKHMHSLNKSMDLATFQKSAEAQKGLIETATVKGAKLGVMESARWTVLVQQLKDLKILQKEITASNAFKNF